MTEVTDGRRGGAPGPTAPGAGEVRELLVALGRSVRDAVLAVRATSAPGALAVVAGATTADTLYAVDTVGDDVLLSWLDRSWPGTVRLVSEGLDEPVVVGGGDPAWTLIVDVLDGTRGLMYDKRPAWVLAAAAPSGRPDLRLRDLSVAAMVEVPTTKQWGSDEISAVRGQGLHATRSDVRDRSAEPVAVTLAPSPATDLTHGFASFARFLPQGKALLAGFEEDLWAALHPDVDRSTLPIFEDQYLATGGQLHELLAGHDRLLGDLRPLALRELGLDAALACHPYDCCTALLLDEVGAVVVGPDGGPLDGPLDTTTPIAWIGFANRALAARVLPLLPGLVGRWFPSWPR